MIPFSRRLDWERSLNPLLEALAARRAAGADIFDLTESNPTRAGLNYDREQLLGALANPAGALYEPAPRGLPAARAAVAGYYVERGWPVSPESLLLTASTSEAYSFLFKLLCDPGDEVLVPRPGYPLFDYLTALDTVRPVSYSLTYTSAEWRINVERLEAAIGPRSRAVVVVSPHNPTGACLSAAENRRLQALCAERNLALIVDEVFADYASEPPAPPRDLSALTFYLNGLSKVAGLPQVKLGWALAAGPAALVAEGLARLEFVSDTYLSASAAAQHAAPALLAGRAAIQTRIRGRLEANYAWLRDQATERCHVLNRAGGWYAVLDFQDSVSDDRRALKALAEHSVFIHPGYFYDFPREGYVVLSLLTPPDRFQEGVRRLLAL